MAFAVPHRFVGLVETKWCRRCEQWLGLDGFGRNAASSDDLQYECKACLSAYKRAAYRSRGGVESLRKAHRFVDGAEQKHCSRCDQWLGLEEFYRLFRRWDGLDGRCKACAYVNNTCTKYGLSFHERESITEAQGGVCFVSGESDDLHTDHCHDSGLVRGRAHGLVNRGLGYFKHEPLRLELAAQYMDRWRRCHGEMWEEGCRDRHVPEGGAPSRVPWIRELRPAQLERQGGRCAICGDVFVSSRGAHWDHDDVTGLLREILCLGCNTGLGQFDHNPQWLRRGATYLASGGFYGMVIASMRTDENWPSRDTEMRKAMLAECEAALDELWPERVDLAA